MFLGSTFRLTSVSGLLGPCAPEPFFHVYPSTPLLLPGAHSAVNIYTATALHRRSRNSGGRRGSVGTPAGGLTGTGAGGTTRRHDKMRKSLIGQTLGKRGSIGTKSLAKNLAPVTPRPEARHRKKQSSAFDFAEEDMDEGRGEVDEDDDGEDFDYGD